MEPQRLLGLVFRLTSLIYSSVFLTAAGQRSPGSLQQELRAAGPSTLTGVQSWTRASLSLNRGRVCRAAEPEKVEVIIKMMRNSINKRSASLG